MTPGRPPEARLGVPLIIAYSSLFPSHVAPNAGLFIRERLRRLAQDQAVVVISPQAWSPFDFLIRLFRPAFRLRGKAFEKTDGLTIYRPKVLSIPGVLKRLDGLFMSLGTKRLVRSLSKGRPALLDAHFAYPDGYAASLNARALGLPMVVTLRGSKDTSLIGTDREKFLKACLEQARYIIAVSSGLLQDVALALGQSKEKLHLVPNGVDVAKFEPVPREQALEFVNAKLNIHAAAQLESQDRILVSVGNLIPLKGFHRLIQCMSRLQAHEPALKLLIVGAEPGQGGNLAELKRLVASEGLQARIIFAGAQPPTELKFFYSCAELFLLASAYEGWANVILEAMACGLPTIVTQVGGNAEVVSSPKFGSLVKFWDEDAFVTAISDGLKTNWSRPQIREYALSNQWDQRIRQLNDLYATIL